MIRSLGGIVDDEVGEVGLPGDRAERHEFRSGEPHKIGNVRPSDWERNRDPRGVLGNGLC